MGDILVDGQRPHVTSADCADLHIGASSFAYHRRTALGARLCPIKDANSHWNELPIFLQREKPGKNSVKKPVKPVKPSQTQPNSGNLGKKPVKPKEPSKNQ